MLNVKTYKMSDELTLTKIMLQLSEFNITGMQIVYEGAGDSGSIENILFTKKPLEHPADISENIDDSWSSEYNLISYGFDPEKVKDLESDIEDIITTILLDKVEDWWNNDGGYGVLNMLVPSGWYEIQNSVRYTEVNTYGHDGNIFNKLEN